jgi:hypothetical protein
MFSRKILYRVATLRILSFASHRAFDLKLMCPKHTGRSANANAILADYGSPSPPSAYRSFEARGRHLYNVTRR